MAQAFTTVYAKDYKWKEYKILEQQGPPKDKFAEALPEGDLWLVKKELEEEFGKDGLHLAKEIVRQMYRKRYITTYRYDYCRQMLLDQNLLSERPDLGDNELVALAGKLYTFPKTEQILPPLPTTRRLFGYLRPSRMYTPLTTYEKIHGELAYDILRGVQPKKLEDIVAENAEINIDSLFDDENKEHGDEKQSGVNKASVKKAKKVRYTGKASGLKMYKYFDDDKKKIICYCPDAFNKKE